MVQVDRVGSNPTPGTGPDRIVASQVCVEDHETYILVTALLAFHTEHGNPSFRCDGNDVERARQAGTGTGAEGSVTRAVSRGGAHLSMRSVRRDVWEKRVSVVGRSIGEHCDGAGQAGSVTNLLTAHRFLPLARTASANSASAKGPTTSTSAA